MPVALRAVTFRYPDAQAGVFDLDLEIAEGELLAVIGPSGSGKSTLLKLLAGFLIPQRGRILIDGHDVTALPPRARDLGVVFQSYALFPHMTAGQNVAYPLKVRGVAAAERRRRAEAALERVGLAGFAGRLPATLSGGQQQRVALARALVFEPRALLLDEPLSALDASLRAGMRDEIARVQREAGIATLHVTHDQEEALSMGTRVAVMREGRILQVASPRDLYDRPASRAVAAFVGHANLWDGRVRADGLVDTPVGPLACATAGHPAGAPVTVLVRPEDVRPLAAAAAAGADGADAVNRFVGALAADRFLGPIRRYDLRVGAGLVKGETSFRGAVAGVAIPPDAVRLLPPDTD
ncbi:ABC transporter ATP-binding protein [Azospirillum sp. ST 5-10]|uniref:ABC transporter ATP-binding protein n=1 Tax=unclassified Azospirillum TaxID=2630922 RepID=UPI003F49B50A